MPLDLLEVLVVAAVIRDGHRILAARRLPGGEAGGRWEFPGGKVEPDEVPEAALRREIHEELGLEIELGPLLGEFATPQGGKLIRLRCYWSDVRRGEIALHAHSAVRWCTASELRGLDWAEADIPAVEVVINQLLLPIRSAAR